MSQTRIAILDYGIGNIKSISNAFERIGANAILTSDRDTIMDSSAFVLPGVGAFAKGMENLHKKELVSIIYEYVNSNRPFLGICLGMQMLLDESEEFGYTKGLGLIKGKVIRLPLPEHTNEKLPHVSWNELKEPKSGRWKETILEPLNLKTDTYFVHSYVAVPEDDCDILARANYGGVNFCAAVHRKNVYGTQFHPEKSGEEGLKILKNFIDLSK
jgi:glutamine amidotransferase